MKRSIEQERNKNFGARNGNFEKNAVVKNKGTKQRVQRILGHCWQWETNGQCVKGDNCSFRHDINNLSCSRVIEKHREPEVPGEEALMHPLPPLQTVEYTFIQTRFHPMTLSSKHDFIQ